MKNDLAWWVRDTADSICGQTGAKTHQEKLHEAAKLVSLCEKFIADNEISCAETVCQTDRVIQNAYEFIEGICKIVGYHKFEE